MGVADDFRRGDPKKAVSAPTAEATETLREFNPFDIFLDGTFPRSVGSEEEKVEYIPLTLAEEQELKTPEAITIRMLAKALKYRLELGLDTPKSAGLDETKSIEENARYMVNQLPTSKREALIVAIRLDSIDRLKSFADFFTKLKEEYKPEEDEAPQRKANALDPFVMFLNTFKETGYTLHDISKMTALQYQAFSMLRYEANVRQANDHSNKSARIKAKAANGNASGKGKGKSGRQIVGS